MKIVKQKTKVFFPNSTLHTTVILSQFFEYISENYNKMLARRKSQTYKL